MTKTMPKVRWVEARQHWRMDARYQNKRKTFYSSAQSERTANAECRAKYLEWIDDIDQHLMDAPPFEDAWEQFIAWYGQTREVTSTRAIDGRGKAHLVDRFAKTRVDKISKVDWQQVIYDALDNGAQSRKTLEGIATTIRTFAKFCATRGWIKDADVPLFFDIPVPAVPSEKKILQPHEFTELMQSGDDEWHIHAFRFLALTGLRRGELCALQMTRDYIDGMIHIRESISHDLIVTKGKTADARRAFVPIPLAVRELEKHHARRAERGITSDYLFCDADGDMIRPRVLGNHWRKWRGEHGIDLTLHELRHTFVSYSRLKTPVELDELKRIIGHSQGMDTEGVYVHAIDKTPAELEAEKRQRDETAKIINQAIELIVDAGGA